MNSERRQPALFRVFTQRKMAAILLLGFSSGLPLYLSSRTLQAWMTLEEVDLTTIGLFSLVALPYSLKFLWAPVMDRYIPPLLGRRRGWLVITQLALLVSIASMSLQDPSRGLQLLAFNALLIAFFSASQDIVVNAYQVDVLEEREMGAGAAIQVLGYRIAMIVTGSVAFVLADRMPWPVVYLLMALLMGIGIFAAIWAPEPVLDEAPPQSLRAAVVEPFIEFFRRTSFWWGLVILLFIILYQLPDRLGQNMVTPFLLQIGFSQTEIGTIQGGIGLFCTILGVLAGGAVIASVGINRSVWIFFFLQILSNLAYYWLSQIGPNGGALLVAIVIEYFSGGLVTAVFVALLMSLSSRRYSATQFALLSSLMSAARDILVAPAGGIAEALGWPGYFLFTLGAGIPALVLLPFVTPWTEENPRGAAEHTGRVLEEGRIRGPAVEERA